MTESNSKRQHSISSQNQAVPLLFKCPGSGSGHGGNGSDLFLAAVLHDLIFDYLTAEDCVVIGLVSHSAGELLDHHLQSRRSLTFTEYGLHGLLPRALAHCRKLARLDILVCALLRWDRRVDTVLAKLITQNAATFQGIFYEGKHFNDAPSVIQEALLCCSSLQEFAAPRLARGVGTSRQLMARPSLLSLSVSCIAPKDFLTVPLSLTNLEVRVEHPSMLQHIVKMSSLTNLQIEIGHHLGLNLKLLEQLPCLTALEVGVTDEEEDAEQANVSVARLLKSRGVSGQGSLYRTGTPDDHDVDVPEVPVVHLSRLQRLVMKCLTHRFLFVKSQNLQHLEFVPDSIAEFEDDPKYDEELAEDPIAIVLGLEMSRESPQIQSLALPFFKIDATGKALFLELCQKWRHLTNLNFSSLDSDALRAVAQSCPRLEVLQSYYHKSFAANDLLAVLALPCLRELVFRTKLRGDDWIELDWRTITTTTPKRKPAPSPKPIASFSSPIVCPLLSRLVLPGKSELIDCLRCPSLRELDIGSEAPLDGLALGSAASLRKLRVGGQVSFRNPRQVMALAAGASSSSSSSVSASSSSPWSLFSQLDEVMIACGLVGAKIAREIVKHVTSLTSLTLVSEGFDVSGIIQSTNPSLKFLYFPTHERFDEEEDSKNGQNRWIDGMRDVVEPLLVPDKLPPNLEQIELISDSGEEEHYEINKLRRNPERYIQKLRRNLRRLRQGSREF